MRNIPRSSFEVRRDTTFESLEALSRTRSLTEREAYLLERAIRRRSEPKGQRLWTEGDKRRLQAYLKRGKKPAQIAILMSRSERAVWRMIYKLGWAVALFCPDDVFTPSRRRGKSAIAIPQSKCESDGQ